MWSSCLALAIILVATAFDLRRREVPDLFALLLLIWAGTILLLRLDGVGWGAHLGGLCLGFLISAPLFALGGLGGGDVKLLTALGAVLGHPAVWDVLFWMALAGGVLALAALARGHRDLAYLPAIALGLTCHILWQLRGGHAAI